MVEPAVASVMVTVWADVNVPVAGEITGVAAGGAVGPVGENVPQTKCLVRVWAALPTRKNTNGARPPPGRTNCRGSCVLNREGHAVRVRVKKLHRKIGGECLNVYGRSEPGAGRLRLPAVGQLQSRAVQLCAPIELQTGGGEPGSKIDAGRAATLNGDN